MARAHDAYRPSLRYKRGSNLISIKVKKNWNLKNSPRLKDDQFFLNPDFKKILTFMK